MGMIKKLFDRGFKLNKPLIEAVENHYVRKIALKSASHFYKFKKRFNKYLKHKAYDKFNHVSLRDLHSMIWKLRKVGGIIHSKLGKLLSKNRFS